MPRTTDNVIADFIQQLDQHGFEAKPKRGAGHTLRIIHKATGTDCGYINPSVKGKGVMGYRFTPFGVERDAAPDSWTKDQTVKRVALRYRLEPDHLEPYSSTARGNVGKIYLVIRSSQIALKILNKDRNHEADQIEVSRESTGGLEEGRLQDVVMSRPERSKKARKVCIDVFGWSCFICGINIKHVYKGLVKEFIHVHHEIPFSSKKGVRSIDPVNDLKPVCPNCHAVLHIKNPPYSIAEVKQMIGIESKG